MTQVIVFDPQSNSFKRDYYIEELLNDWLSWWERHI